MLPYQKPKIAILTIRNSYNYGGVLSNLKIAYEFCEQYFTPTVFFLGFEPDIATSIHRGKFTSSIKPLVYFGMNCVEIGARWSFWEPGHYTFTKKHWQTLLKDYTYFFAISGTCIAAHPLALLEKKFAMWIGTPYFEDREERVKHLKGIHKILNALAHKRMKTIEQDILDKAQTTFAIGSYAYKKLQTMRTNTHNKLVQCGFPINCSKASLVQVPKENIILAVGRFSDPRKNIDMLMRVFDGIHQQIPSMRLYVVGVKPTSDTILTWSTKASFKNVSIIGQVSSTDLTKLFEKASLLLITSYQEGLGIVGLEALLHGTPVVATDCGGTRDYVINEKTGFLVAVNDDQTMIQKSVTLLTDKALHTQYSLEGQKLIREEFALPKIYTKLQDGLSFIYPELADWFKRCDKEQYQQALHKSQTLLQMGNA